MLRLKNVTIRYVDGQQEVHIADPFLPNGSNTLVLLFHGSALHVPLAQIRNWEVTDARVEQE